MHSVDYLVMCLHNFNGHIDGVHGGYDVGQRNVEVLLEFFMEKELCVSNAWFRRGEKGNIHNGRK